MKIRLGENRKTQNLGLREWKQARLTIYWLRWKFYASIRVEENKILELRSTLMSQTSVG